MTEPFSAVLVNFFEEYPGIFIIMGILTCLLGYYKQYVIKKPLLVCGDTKLRQFLLQYCPILSEEYIPTWWCFESRAQTIVRLILKTYPNVTFSRDVLKLSDGGQVVLDWQENNDCEIYKDTASRPTVLMLPGLTGSSRESYILHLTKEATDLGCRVVVFNNRGITSELLTPRTYCAANTEDLQCVVTHIKQRLPKAPLAAIGISMGGMILLNYVSKHGVQCGLTAAMTVSMPWNAFETTKTLEQPLNYFLFNKWLASDLRQNVKMRKAMFQDQVDVEHILKGETIRDFDERFTSKMFGYESVDHYYKDACLHKKLHTLKIPVLCLNAADDPFSPYHALPIKDAEEKGNDNVALIVTSHGGHIGFLEGWWPRHASYMDRVFSQFINAIFTHGDQLYGAPKI